MIYKATLLAQFWIDGATKLGATVEIYLYLGGATRSYVCIITKARYPGPIIQVSVLIPSCEFHYIIHSNQYSIFDIDNTGKYEWTRSKPTHCWQRDHRTWWQAFFWEHSVMIYFHFQRSQIDFGKKVYLNFNFNFVIPLPFY